MESKIFLNPFNYTYPQTNSLELVRKVTRNDSQTQKLDLMPGFTISWYFSECITTTTTTTTTDWANWADFDSWSGLESFESGNGFGSTNNTTANTSTTTESWNWAQFNTGFGNSIEFEAKRKKRSAILTLSKDVDLTRLFVRKIPIRNIIPLQFTHVPLFYFSC